MAAPLCPVYGTCGGCTLQHLAPDDYAAHKRALVVCALRDAGIVAPVASLVDARGTGRRRVTMHTDGHSAGYMRARSHDLLDLDACPVLVPQLERLAPEVTRAVGRLAGECDVRITVTDTGLDVGIRSRSRPPPLGAELARQHALARLTWNGETLVQFRQPTLRMGVADVPLPVDGFLQATTAAEERLAQLVCGSAGKARTVADLFCGVGPFALRLAARAKVNAFDSDRAAIAALDEARRHAQGLKPVTAKVRDLFREPLVPIELNRYDAVVLDPPRAGALAQVGELARSTVPRVVYVSCNPRSFARDASILLAAGYRIGEVTPMDQFAYAQHVELVGVFTR